ncbi:histidine phosphatase family protein [Maritimibacter sp. HL-12]|jgi:hypothetical protein|uniref:histidine phosphatase family protein n=1 Tax=Maritimibacter sp. HL-12 TaxID=1162418 RepID=UPI000A0F047D|nr:histidine phosphatase family protein [Maritimibacter sp. HL-12]SMH52353.1 Fructose-2,6-bisphosphatase [Maritimibacter sp. HL-12]
MLRRRFLALAAVPMVSACAGLVGGDTGAKTQPRLIVLRHAERDGADLNAAGIARAHALPTALADQPVDAIFAPDLQRNIDTATPLARARGLEVSVIPAVNTARAMFRRYPGGRVVWVGNKDNLAALWDEIGAAGEPPILYGELFVVSMNGLSAGRIERRRFGD